MALALDGNEIGAYISGTCISELRFANNTCLLPNCTDGLQQIVDKVHTTRTSNRFGLKVNCAKTEVQCIGRDEQQMKILLENQELQQSEEFVYLGGVISQDTSCQKDVARRIGLAAGIVRRLHKVRKDEYN